MIPLLQGLTIVDMTAIILGPYATQILGDMGATIIKVEPPEGDSMRTIAPVAEPGISAVFANSNRNKKSLMLDLKTETGRTALGYVVKRADALVHNMRQEAVDRLGFGFEAARKINPNLVYCAGVGFGSKGTYAGQPAYDDVIQAASGFAGLFALRDGTPLYAPSIAADKIVGLHLVYATLAALLHRERTGSPPGYVEVPMFEAMAAFSLTEHLGEATFNDDGSIGYPRVLSKDRRPFKTEDGWIGVLPYSLENWSKILREIGRGDIVEQAWFRHPTERSKRIGELYAILADAMLTRTSAHWLALFHKFDIPHAPVRLPSDLMADPHLKATRFFEPDFAEPSAVKRGLRQAVSVDGVTRVPDHPPPRLGEDTEDVLRAAGCPDDVVKAAMVTAKG
jgi:crotonobetainyl-CoA:carnitine CoA-transferase CaiB-like acyl-CoA transferase